jgi:hypothetical protein
MMANEIAERLVQQQPELLKEPTQLLCGMKKTGKCIGPKWTSRPSFNDETKKVN